MKIHMVKKGESLYLIAQKYNVPLQLLIDTNPGFDPENLQIGAKVTIPDQPKPVYELMHQHSVKQGETLWKLAKAWGIPLADMIHANPQLKNPHALLTGEVVNIPKLPAGGWTTQNVAPNLPGKKHTGVKPEAPVTFAPAAAETPPAAPELPAAHVFPNPPVMPAHEMKDGYPTGYHHEHDLFAQYPTPAVEAAAEQHFPAFPESAAMPNMQNIGMMPNMMPSVTLPISKVMPHEMANVMPNAIQHEMANVMPHVMPYEMPNVMPHQMANMMPNVMPYEMVNVMPNLPTNIMPAGENAGWAGEPANAAAIHEQYAYDHHFGHHHHHHMFPYGYGYSYAGEYSQDNIPAPGGLKGAVESVYDPKDLSGFGTPAGTTGYGGYGAFKSNMQQTGYGGTSGFGDVGPTPGKPSYPTAVSPAATGPYPGYPANADFTAVSPAATSPYPGYPANAGFTAVSPAATGPYPDYPAKAGPTAVSPAATGPYPDYPAKAGPTAVSPAAMGPWPGMPNYAPGMYPGAVSPAAGMTKPAAGCPTCGGPMYPVSPAMPTAPAPTAVSPAAIGPADAGYPPAAWPGGYGLPPAVMDNAPGYPYGFSPYGYDPHLNVPYDPYHGMYPAVPGAYPAAAVPGAVYPAAGYGLPYGAPYSGGYPAPEFCYPYGAPYPSGGISGIAPIPTMPPLYDREPQPEDSTSVSLHGSEDEPADGLPSRKVNKQSPKPNTKSVSSRRPKGRRKESLPWIKW